MRYIYSVIILFVFLLSCDAKKKHPEINTYDSLNSEVDSQANLKRNNVEIIGLLYHRFGDERYPTTNISNALFEAQLKYIQESGIKVITFSEAIRKMFDENSYERYVVISIDDGFKSFINNGFPILKKYGFPATMFVNTETVGSGDYLSWDDLKLISSAGIEIGNHTHSHGYFLNIDQSERYYRFKKDVLYSQNILEEKLDLKPSVFAYPYGEYDSLMKKEIENLGFIGAAAQNSGVISKYSDIYALPRFPMTDVYGKMETFKEKIALKPLPVIFESPQATIANDNPPQLHIKLDDGTFNMDQIQCFIQGGSCQLLNINPSDRSIKVVADDELKSRRHLYTITIPGTSGKEWYWYSHQWIFPSIKE